MSVEKYTNEELQEMSLIDIAFELLHGAKTPYSFHEIVAEVARLLELSDAEVDSKIAQFYTDVNIDGRFLSLGDNRWGLRTWYTVDKSEEDIVTVTKPKKKKAKKASEDDFDDYDELEEEEYEDFEEELEDDDLLDAEEEEEEDDDDLLDDDLAEEDSDDDDFEEDIDETYEMDEDLDEEDEDEAEEEFEEEEEDK